MASALLSGSWLGFAIVVAISGYVPSANLGYSIGVTVGVLLMVLNHD